MFVLTVILTLTWQFAQFVLLLQTLVLFALAATNLVDKHKVTDSTRISLYFK